MSQIGPVQRQFGRTAAAYVDSATHARGEDLDRIVALASEHGGERLVDVGTGVSHTLRRVAPSFAAAIGVDATREMLDAGRTVLAGAGVANAILVQADATALPIANQVSAYLASGNVDANALYTVWGGANDVFFQVGLAGAGLATSAQVQAGITQAATDELAQIARLHAAGARYIVVMNLPDIGRTPLGTATPTAPFSALSSLAVSG